MQHPPSAYQPPALPRPALRNPISTATWRLTTHACLTGPQTTLLRMYPPPPGAFSMWLLFRRELGTVTPSRNLFAIGKHPHTPCRTSLPPTVTHLAGQLHVLQLLLGLLRGQDVAVGVWAW